MGSDPVLGVVVIGRNEGERLRRSLESLARHAPGSPIVYVDSGSTDGSMQLATTMDCAAISLDLAVAFTAARARNTGADWLLGQHPDIDFVFFLDGDCELSPGFLDAAIGTMDDGAVAVVCGRRRERWPDRSIFNRLIDIEWDTPVGEARACGGDALIRAKAFRDAGGYDPGIIAGEEPELCLRLRRAGWKILRIDHEMALHDAAMTRFGQWWRRAVRSGHGYTEGAWRYGLGPERYNLRELVSILAWSLAAPVAGVAMVVVGWAMWGALVAVVAAGVFAGLHAAQLVKLALRGRRRGMPARVAWAWAGSMMVCKYAQLLGVLTFTRRRLSRAQPTLIEYKGSGPGPRTT